MKKMWETLDRRFDVVSTRLARRQRQWASLGLAAPDRGRPRLSRSDLRELLLCVVSLRRGTVAPCRVWGARARTGSPACGISKRRNGYLVRSGRSVRFWRQLAENVDVPRIGVEGFETEPSQTGDE